MTALYTLRDLLKRLEELRHHDDPAERKALASWIERGGLDSLKGPLLDFLKSEAVEVYGSKQEPPKMVNITPNETIYELANQVQRTVDRPIHIAVMREGKFHRVDNNDLVSTWKGEKLYYQPQYSEGQFGYIVTEDGQPKTKDAYFLPLDAKVINLFEKIYHSLDKPLAAIGWRDKEGTFHTLTNLDEPLIHYYYQPLVYEVSPLKGS